jgi:hypothetical protein
MRVRALWWSFLAGATLAVAVHEVISNPPWFTYDLSGSVYAYRRNIITGGRQRMLMADYTTQQVDLWEPLPPGAPKEPP